MIRPLTLAAALLAGGSALYLYQAKHAARLLDRAIEGAVRDTAAVRAQGRRLAAEWVVRNDPEALRRFADDHLALRPVTPSQFTSLAGLDRRLPPAPVPAQAAPAVAVDEALPVPPAPATAHEGGMRVSGVLAPAGGQAR